MQVHASFYHINYQYHMRYVKRIAKLQITYRGVQNPPVPANPPRQ
jgi:hypothetical protein